VPDPGGARDRRATETLGSDGKRRASRGGRHRGGSQQEIRMSTTEQNKAIVRRFVDEIFVQGRKEVVDECSADDFVAHTWPSTTGNPRDDLKAAIDRVGGALENPSFTIDGLIAEGDTVAARLT